MGFAERVNRVLADDGRALVLAMDHGRVHGAISGLGRPAELVAELAEHGAEAVLANVGLLHRYAGEVADQVPVVARLDGGETIYRSEWLEYDEWRQLFDVHTAVDCGASGVATMTFLGAPCELDTVEITARSAAEAAAAGLPTMAEALPCRGPRIPDPLAAKPMADAAQVAFEHGADLVKNYYTGSIEGDAQSVRAVPVPVLMAGGEKMATVEDVLRTTKDAMAAGAAGAVIGRNIWQHPDPHGITNALAAVIHDDAPVDDALRLVRQ